MSNASLSKEIPFLNAQIAFEHNIFTGLPSDARSSQNFNQSSGESQKATGSDLDPKISQLLVTLSQFLISRAKELSSAGKLTESTFKI